MNIKNAFKELSEFLDLSVVAPDSFDFVRVKGGFRCQECSQGNLENSCFISVQSLLDGLCDCGWEEIDASHASYIRVGDNEHEDSWLMPYYINHALIAFKQAASFELPSSPESLLEELIEFDSLRWELTVTNPDIFINLGWFDLVKEALTKAYRNYAKAYASNPRIFHWAFYKQADLQTRQSIMESNSLGSSAQVVASAGMSRIDSYWHPVFGDASDAFWSGRNFLMVLPEFCRSFVYEDKALDVPPSLWGSGEFKEIASGLFDSGNYKELSDAVEAAAVLCQK